MGEVELRRGSISAPFHHNVDMAAYHHLGHLLPHFLYRRGRYPLLLSNGSWAARVLHLNCEMNSHYLRHITLFLILLRILLNHLYVAIL